MSKFQLILLIVFGAFILIAVMIFSLSRAGSGSSATVTVWGDIPTGEWGSFATEAGLASDRNLTIQYSERPASELMDEFVEALAESRAPDLIILPAENLWEQKNRLLPIPYESVSERDFKSVFVEEGELFLSQEGIYALPLTVDPLVLYYNRDLLSRAGIAEPLAYWDEIYDDASQLSVKDAAGNLKKSAIALGEANNIPNFKEIMSLLLLQAGTPITAKASGASGSTELRSAFLANPGLPLSPAEAALDFYTQFSNPAKAFYSWNRSQLPAQTHFAAGDSAYYVGFASELPLIRAKNPTLNFAVAPVPQSRVSEKTVTFGRLKGIAISRGARNPGAALVAATKIAGRDAAGAISQALLLPPARRDLLSAKPGDSVLSVFYEAALQSRGWVDPDAEATESIFRDMIESVTSGRARVSEATSRANRELEQIIR